MRVRVIQLMFYNWFFIFISFFDNLFANLSFLNLFLSIFYVEREMGGRKG